MPTPVLPPLADIEAAALSVSLDDQIKCVRRELEMRFKVYGRQVGERRLSSAAAAREIAAMTAVRNTLLDVDTHELEIQRAENNRLRERIRELERQMEHP